MCSAREGRREVRCEGAGGGRECMTSGVSLSRICEGQVHECPDFDERAPGPAREETRAAKAVERRGGNAGMVGT